MLLRKLVTSLFTGPLFVLAWFLLSQIRLLPGGLTDSGRIDLAASLFLLGSYAYLFTYGLLCSFVIDLTAEKLNPRIPGFIRLPLYLFAGLVFHLATEPGGANQDPFLPTLLPGTLCALIFFAVEEAFLRTDWLERRKKLVIAAGIIWPLAVSLRTGWQLLK